MKNFILAGLASAMFLCSLTACEKKEGDSCKKGALRCVDEKSALSCDKGKLVTINCGGKDGCQKKDKRTSCDVSGNKPGSACTDSLEGKGGCSEDKSSLVKCKGGKFVEVACRGKKGCSSTDGGYACDKSLALEGDACSGGKGVLCAVNGKSRLACVDGEMKKDMDCLGKKGCRIEGKKVRCDLTVAKEGANCNGTGSACSSTGKKMLSCDGGKFVSKNDCKGGCKVLDGPGGKGSKIVCTKI
jgi:hypothetical protein